MSSDLERVIAISEDILQKISEVKEDSDVYKFLFIKKTILDDYLQKIINEAQINKDEYELCSLYERCETLKYKISMKERCDIREDEDIKALKEAKVQIALLHKTKLKGVKLTYTPNLTGILFYAK